MPSRDATTHWEGGLQDGKGQVTLDSSNVGQFNVSSDPANLVYNNPTRRDTALLPGGGWLAIAFPTDNPGAWLMHCHIVSLFLPGSWEASTFVFSYFMIFLTPVLFIGWKVIKRTKFRPLDPTSVDLKGEVEEIDEVCIFLRSRLEDALIADLLLAVHPQLCAAALQELL